VRVGYTLTPQLAAVAAAVAEQISNADGSTAWAWELISLRRECR